MSSVSDVLGSVEGFSSFLLLVGVIFVLVDMLVGSVDWKSIVKILTKMAVAYRTNFRRVGFAVVFLGLFLKFLEIHWITASALHSDAQVGLASNTAFFGGLVVGGIAAVAGMMVGFVSNSTGHGAMSRPSRKERCAKCMKIGHMEKACHNFVVKDGFGRVRTLVELKAGATNVQHKQDRTQLDKMQTVESIMEILRNAAVGRAQKAQVRRRAAKKEKQKNKMVSDVAENSVV